MRKVYLVLGKTGSGKTTLAKEIRKKFNRIITLDPLKQYDGVIFKTFRELYEHIQSRLDQWEFLEFSYTCRFQSDEEYEQVFAMARTLNNFLLVVEETDMFLKPRDPDSNFMWLINYGRHRNISLLCVGRRAPEITIGMRAQATSVVTFRQNEPNDLKLLEAYGFEPGRVSKLEQFKYEYVGENPV